MLLGSTFSSFVRARKTFVVELEQERFLCHLGNMFSTDSCCSLQVGSGAWLIRCTLPRWSAASARSSSPALSAWTGSPSRGSCPVCTASAPAASKVSSRNKVNATRCPARCVVRVTHFQRMASKISKRISGLQIDYFSAHQNKKYFWVVRRYCMRLLKFQTAEFAGIH